MRLLKQSTARSIVVFMTDSTDHVTGKTGLTLTITSSKDGAAFSSISPTVTELANGWYKLALTTGHTDTLGDLALHITSTGADPTDLTLQVCADLPGIVATNNDKTGYTLSAAGVQAIWDALTSALTTASSVGKLLVDNINATVSSRSTLTAANVWDALTSGISTSGSIGKQIKDNLDVVVSTRLASSSYTAPDNSSITAIKAKTDNLPASPAATSDIPSAATIASTVWDKLTSALTTVGSVGKLLVDNVNASLQDIMDISNDNNSAISDLDSKIGNPNRGTVSNDIDDIHGTVLDIKAQTDLLPGDPCSTSAVSTRFDTLDAVIGTPDTSSLAGDIAQNYAHISDTVSITNGIQTDVTAIKAKTDTIPVSPATQSVKKNTALAGFQFPMTDSTTGLPATGLTVVAKRSIDGGAFSNCANSVVELANGWYKIDLAAADLNGASVALEFSATGANQTNATVLTDA